MRLLVVLAWLWVLTGSAAADQYDDAISEAFPGHRIVQPSERWLPKEEMDPEDYEKARNAPAVIVGRFNHDQYEDFAAYTLDPASKRRPHGLSESFGAYSGGLAVCFGREGGRYRCQRIQPEGVLIPHPWYLERIPPREQRCPAEPSDRSTIRLTSDALGVWPMLGTAGRVLIFQPDDSILECSFD